MTGPDLTCEGPDRLVAASANLKRARVAAPRAAGGHGPVTVTVTVPHLHTVCVFQVEGVAGHHPPRQDGRLVAPAGVPGRTAQRDVPVVVNPDGG